nr:alpha/beta hydrolase [Rhodococcus rhodnii]
MMKKLRLAAVALICTLAVLVCGCASFTERGAAATAPPPAAAAFPVTPATTTRIEYGPEPDRFGDLYLPTSSSTALPVVVMIHGGGWRQETPLDYFAPLSRSLADAGVAVWNIEYRRVGGAGGYPTTLLDVAAAVDALADVVQARADGRLDLSRVVVAGHSAGGQLAAWVASRHVLPPGSPGAEPRVRPRAATVMAGVFDLPRAVSTGDAFLVRFLGGSPAHVPDRYAVASPIRHLPTRVPIHAIHGNADRTVPVEQSRMYVDAARGAGDQASLTVMPGVGHGEFGNVTSPAWRLAQASILAQATV